MSSIDEIIRLYKKDVDRTLIRENLKLSPEERLRKAQQVARTAEELREAGKALRKPRSRLVQALEPVHPYPRGAPPPSARIRQLYGARLARTAR